MKKIISVCLAAVIAMALLAFPAFAESDVPYVYVTIADENGELVLANQYVPLTSDGMTLDDALRAAHEQFSDEEHGYVSEQTQWGRSIVSLWGVENGGSYGYYINDASAMSLLDEVKSGDRVCAFVYTDTMNFSDTYSYFDSHILYNLERGDEVTLTLMQAGFDENWMPVSLPVSGAVITVNGKATESITDENGKVTIVLNDAGTLLISAQKEGTNLVPPACVANVEGLSNAMIGVMVGVVGFVIVLAIGVALFIVLRTVKVAGKEKEDE